MQLLRLLREQGLPGFLVPGASVSSAVLGWGSPGFHQMGRERVKLVRMALRLNMSVLFSDIDAVWLRDPIPYLQQVGHP